MRPSALARPEQTFSPAVYQSALSAGRAGVAAWLAQHELSLAQFRDQHRAVFVASLEWSTATPEIKFAFDQGFAEGIAQLFAGARHD